jgi:hypothetical protein
VAGSQHNITWTHNYTATQAFDIDFSGDGGATWSRMASSVPAATATTGSYSAVMPNIITAGALVRVTATGQPLASDSDTSDSTFALIPPRIIVRP